MKSKTKKVKICKLQIYENLVLSENLELGNLYLSRYLNFEVLHEVMINPNPLIEKDQRKNPSSIGNLYAYVLLYVTL